jgi:hypothetical protein
MTLKQITTNKLTHSFSFNKGNNITISTPLKIISKLQLNNLQFLIARSYKTAVSWYAAPCSLVDTDRRFRGAYYLHHQGATPQKTAIFILVAVRTSNLSSKLIFILMFNAVTQQFNSNHTSPTTGVQSSGCQTVCRE